MSFILGLDVGTASGAGATKRDGRVQPCALGDRTATLPAVVVLHDDGSALVGDEAERIAGLELTRVARSLRHDPVLQMTPITVGGEIRTPHELLRTLYATMVQRVGGIHGAAPTHFVLAHPAVPEGVRCDAVERIAEEMFPGALVVPEPVAATVKLACDAVLPADCLVAVYDFGGGTFDTSLVQREGDRFSIIGDPAGLSDFGGIDVDDLVLDHVDRTLDSAISRLDLGDPASIAALSRLRAACRDAKERLSYETEVTIDASLPNQPALVQLTRADFERILYPHLEMTVDVLVEMLDRAGVRGSSVDAVALIGGSSRIPAVAEMVSSRTGMQVLVDPYPELTVALGAAQMMDDDDSSGITAFPLADLALPSLGALSASTAAGYDAMMPGDGGVAGTAVGTAVAHMGHRDTPSGEQPYYEYDDDEFDMGTRSKFSELVGQSLNVRAGAALLSALAGVAVVIAGAVALGGGGGGGGGNDATTDLGGGNALGSEETVGNRAEGLPASSSSSAVDSTSPSSSSTTTTDDDSEGDDGDGGDGDGTPEPTEPRPGTGQPGTTTSRPGSSTTRPRPSTTTTDSTTTTTDSTTTTTDSTTTTTDSTTTTTGSSTTSSTDDLAPSLRETDRAD